MPAVPAVKWWYVGGEQRRATTDVRRAAGDSAQAAVATWGSLTAATVYTATIRVARATTHSRRSWVLGGSGAIAHWGALNVTGAVLLCAGRQRRRARGLLTRAAMAEVAAIARAIVLEEAWSRQMRHEKAVMAAAVSGRRRAATAGEQRRKASAAAVAATGPSSSGAMRRRWRTAYANDGRWQIRQCQ